MVLKYFFLSWLFFSLVGPLAASDFAASHSHKATQDFLIGRTFLENHGQPSIQGSSMPGNDWWSSLCTWSTQDNLLFVVKALLRIFLILVIYITLQKMISHFVTYYTQKITEIRNGKHSQSTTLAVIKTVTPIIRSTIHWILIVLATLLILSELNINIMPIIYSFSVIGLAISIGSQTLVKDLINGIMTLFEGNMAVGDVVTIGNFKGTVESISLRCVHLRHSTGELQTIPFSEVNHVMNHSRDYNMAMVEFNISYQTKLHHVEQALEETYHQMKENPEYAPYIEGELKRIGIEKLGDWGAKIQTSIKTKPDPSQVFLHEFYRVLLAELQKRNITPVVAPVVVGDIKSLRQREDLIDPDPKF